MINEQMKLYNMIVAVRINVRKYTSTNTLYHYNYWEFSIKGEDKTVCVAAENLDTYSHFRKAFIAKLCRPAPEVTSKQFREITAWLHEKNKTMIIDRTKECLKDREEMDTYYNKRFEDFRTQVEEENESLQNSNFTRARKSASKGTKHTKM